MKKFPCVLAGLAFTLLSLGWTADANAQRAVLAGAVDVMSGIEGGGSGYASGVRRARTTLRVGVEGYNDEFPKNIYTAAAIVELEPRASIGADLRYVRMFGDELALNIGAQAILAPKPLIGASFGAGYRLGLGDTWKLQVGPTINVYFLGADLPDKQVLWQGMLGAGVRLEL